MRNVRFWILLIPWLLTFHLTEVRAEDGKCFDADLTTNRTAWSAIELNNWRSGGSAGQLLVINCQGLAVLKTALSDKFDIVDLRSGSSCAIEAPAASLFANPAAPPTGSGVLVTEQFFMPGIVPLLIGYFAAHQSQNCIGMLRTTADGKPDLIVLFQGDQGLVQAEARKDQQVVSVRKVIEFPLRSPDRVLSWRTLSALGALSTGVVEMLGPRGLAGSIKEAQTAVIFDEYAQGFFTFLLCAPDEVDSRIQKVGLLRVKSFERLAPASSSAALERLLAGTEDGVDPVALLYCGEPQLN